MSVAFRLNEAQRQAIDRAALHFGFSAFEKQEFEYQIEQAPFEEAELILCAADREYWIRNYAYIYDPEAQDWISFDLWPEQVEVLDTVIENQLVIVIKARQIGLTWLMLAYALHEMLFRPIAEVLLFSKREDEALYLLGEERLRGMYQHLPDWMKPGVITDAAKHFQLANGSSARAFPSNAGDSYTATFALIDEADLVPDLKSLLSRVKPTIDAGGKLVMISRSDKSKPQSLFKQIYKAAKQKLNAWAAVFLAWYVHPGRDEAWYQRQCDDAMQNEGSLDTVHEQYPATDEEAMNPASLHKRIPAGWLDACWQTLESIDVNPLGLEGLTIYCKPERFRTYVGGADCAEGLATSDDSVTQWIDAETGEQVAVLAGKLTPATHAYYSARISEYYNDARLLIENNNHGHAMILWLNDNGYSKYVMPGHNGKDGWTSNTLGKALMYDTGAESAKTGDTIIHDYTTLTQLKAIEKSTLRAPDGEMDDYADAYVLALEARKGRSKNRVEHRVGKVVWRDG